MNLPQNDWDAIRHFYRSWDKSIKASRRDEWAMDAYEWDNGMLRMTPIETWLWADIRNNNAILYPQYPVGRFFVDFANPVAQVAIECDGAAYHTDKEKDEARDAQLRAQGWGVYRITGRDCRTESDEETSAPGTAFRFIDSICDNHGIRRNPRPTGFADWVSVSELLAAEVHMSMRIRAECRDMARSRKAT